MSLRSVTAAALLIVIPAALSAAEPENPFKKAEKGQWVSYKLTAKAMGMDFNGSIKQTVTDKDDKTVNLEIAASFMGNDFPAQTVKVDLTKPFNPLAAGGTPPGTETKLEKTDSGKETIEVGGKKYECEWTKYKVTGSANGADLTGESKVWLTKDIPISGMLKMQSKIKFGEVEFESTMQHDKSGKN